MHTPYTPPLQHAPYTPPLQRKGIKNNYPTYKGIKNNYPTYKILNASHFKKKFNNIFP